MAFRTQTKTYAGLMLFAALLHASTVKSYSVIHKHLYKGATGIVRIDENKIQFEEAGRGASHSRTWRYQDIQHLQLSPNTLRIVTYEDNRLEMGRDRVYLFEDTSPELANDWYPFFSQRLDSRFVAALADDLTKPLWQRPVKLAGLRGGPQGILLVAADSVVFRTSSAAASRTWRIKDIENVSSSDPHDLTITTNEREFRFQLKEELSAADYQQLWRRVNQRQGLKLLNGE